MLALSGSRFAATSLSRRERENVLLEILKWDRMHPL